MHRNTALACLAAFGLGVQPAAADHNGTPGYGTYTCAMMGAGGVTPMGSFTIGGNTSSSYYTTNPGDGTRWPINYYPNHQIIFQGNLSRFIGLYRGYIDGAHVIELWGLNPWGNRVKMTTCAYR